MAKDTLAKLLRASHESTPQNVLASLCHARRERAGHYVACGWPSRCIHATFLGFRQDSSVQGRRFEMNHELSST